MTVGFGRRSAVESAVMSAAARLWFRRLLFLLLLIAGIAWFVGRGRRGNRPAEANVNAAQAIPVSVAKARKGDLPVYLNGLGSVNGFTTVVLRTRVDGELMQFAVKEGQIVEAGDLIGEIDPRPFQVQLEQAEGQREKDQAALANARIDRERYRVLLAQNAISQQQYDTQISTVNQLEAAVKVDQGAVDNARLQLIYTRITAPVTGRIGLRQVDPGNIVHASDTNGLATIAQIQPIVVIFNLDQDDVPPVMKKLQAGRTLAVEAYDREMKERIATGTLLTVDNQADTNTGTVRLKAVFSNTDHALFPNQFVNARLRLDTKRNVILIPTAALQRGPQTTFVFVVKPDSTIETRNVQAGLTEGGHVAIDQGLAEGETVVTQGVDKLQQGSRVTTEHANRR
jgi:membrane fusion protein, multidrug efflux system